MKRIIPIILTLACTLSSMQSCVKLDIIPKNIVTDNELFNTPASADIYMARMYSQMPFEDFKYMGQWGFRYNGWLNSIGIDGTGEAVNRDGITTAFTGEQTTYWGQAFELIRDANHLIETLPQYQANFSEELYNHYLGEAYYIRATVFYTMAKRFGGIPLVTKVIQYPAADAEIEVARSTEEETWDQVLADFDQAIELLQDRSPKEGYSSKYIALAFKAQAMLYAGSVAKYNETVSGRLTGVGRKTQVRVIGFDESRWQSASKRYFAESYKAARRVMQDGGYSLYRRRWAAGDKQAQYQNMVDMFSDLSSPENIYVKRYLFPTLTHAFDAYNMPFSFRAPLSAGTCPTLDFVELFEGFPRYPDGKIRVTTGTSNASGEYVLYDNPMQFFENAEPRLRAYVIFPFDQFRSRQIEVRAGVYTGESPIQPFFTNYAYNTADERYQNLSIFNGNNKSLYLSPREGNGQQVVQYQGRSLTAAGQDGPFFDNGEATLTGLYVRKWLQTTTNIETGEGKSAQPFILMRYAEILLTAAEAAIELEMAGEASPDGSSMLQVATESINQIRERAGASLLAVNLSADNASRDIVRKERRKELAFEHKSKWDIRRWRVNHYEGRDGFWGEVRDKNFYSNNENYRFRGLYPFFSTAEGKYFFDTRFQWVSSKTFGYQPIDYYFSIPGGEVAKSPLIDQQPNR
ncbi:RagB/SusD family nutrient uptake outer membrane protein [Sphingobacterium sp. lm-10]|uniref:RagB/SusD family nutrient uptake outer membrane protein n=1 Tax=Sphingobacterium sp. lm-10 TaxID=2944904 RepID=UPI002021E270|nr:RagB/SusD family nutrient uptake outer membrane protein [Sphingobacterium sp. lm-10]MCL7987240.1 RagB/SusD family nutrient uptake outer membrane protein [Sphingobacterium sp. lm-10]